ncbi:MAG: D-aminoacyl-tRNA deacylase [Patescibacteria group bacterium]|jgi:D-tyrosyl-tRNA(Tyr) deacylase
MRAVVQRVSQASVSISGKIVGKIDNGLVVLLGVTHCDSEAEVDWLVKKIVNMRIFADKEGKMNLSLIETKGQLLIISQFTLYAETQKGNRPSFIESAKPEKAKKLYNLFIEKCHRSGITTESGRFGAMMDVTLVNSGPVTIILER